MLITQALTLTLSRKREGGCRGCIHCCMRGIWKRARVRARGPQRNSRRPIRRTIELTLRRRVERRLAPPPAAAQSIATSLTINTAWHLHCQLPIVHLHTRLDPKPARAGQGPQVASRSAMSIATTRSAQRRPSVSDRARETSTPIASTTHRQLQTIELHRATRSDSGTFVSSTRRLITLPTLTMRRATWRRGPSPSGHRVSASALPTAPVMADPTPRSADPFLPIALRARSIPATPASPQVASHPATRAIDLVWRRHAPTRNDESASQAMPSAAAAPRSPARVETSPHTFASSQPPTTPARLDPAITDRLADEVMKRVERQRRIERERRGL